MYSFDLILFLIDIRSFPMTPSSNRPGIEMSGTRSGLWIRLGSSVRPVVSRERAQQVDRGSCIDDSRTTQSDELEILLRPGQLCILRYEGLMRVYVACGSIRHGQFGLCHSALPISIRVPNYSKKPSSTGCPRSVILSTLELPRLLQLTKFPQLLAMTCL